MREHRDRATQQLGFASRPFRAVRPPCATSAATTLLYKRRNGLFTRQDTGHPEFGLPFGQYRLVPIFPATLAVRQQSQTIRFRSAWELLDTLGLQRAGRSIAD